MSIISVAMATYNGEKYIECQLQSLLEQTRKPDEVIIFDDCSTDSTARKVSDFIKCNKLENWILYENIKNLGFVKNFIQSISSVSGDIIFLCDQDDVWHNDKIEKMSLLFEKHPDIKVLNSAFRKIDQNETYIHDKRKLHHSNGNLITKTLKPESLSRICFNYIIWRNISPGCTAAFTRECQTFYLQNHTKLCPHDWELNIFGSVLGGLYFYNEVLTDYRIHPGNTIGLSKVSLGKGRGAINSDKRFFTVEEEKLRIRAYLDATWCDGISQKAKKALTKVALLTDIRFRAIRERRFDLWLRLLAHIPSYIKLRGPQGIFNDIVFIIRQESVASKYNQL